MEDVFSKRKAQGSHIRTGIASGVFLFFIRCFLGGWWLGAKSRPYGKWLSPIVFPIIHTWVELVAWSLTTVMNEVPRMWREREKKKPVSSAHESGREVK